ncbi:ImmA/IrrE family metallo-endopeptidase [Chondromyces apiculatus]|uniref:ImmA/IrrE family metallo-endopeptidase n=1 Tax=Chondromyces apiculatus TaxID=51 RepID=UPI0018CBF4EA|nr:ImmA/IrrE family metallo-endopeptidase [Chondromyces apiculatus]
MIWPIGVHGEIVIGYEDPKSSLESAISEGKAIPLNAPFSAAAKEELVRSFDGDYLMVSKESIIRSRNEEVDRRLRTALQAFADGSEFEKIQEAFDGAILVDIYEQVPALLRAGVAATYRKQEPSWHRECIDDLNKATEVGCRLENLRDHYMWKNLPHEELKESLFRRARRSLDDFLAPNTELEPPIGTDEQAAAIATALCRQSVRDPLNLSHTVLTKLLTGDPEAVRATRSELMQNARWNELFKKVADSMPHGKVTAIDLPDRDVNIAIAHSKISDLTRFARTLQRLEQLEGNARRLDSWRWFIHELQGVHQWRESRPWRQGELAAIEVRRQLSLNGDPIQSMRSFAQKNGMFVGVASLAADAIDAAAICTRNVAPCVFLNDRKSGPKRMLSRFSIAHEICHLLMDRRHRHSDSWICRTDFVDTDRTLMYEMESRANAFAAYFLAPRESVRKLVPDLPQLASPEFISAVLKVRAHFGLTAITAAEHLINCFQEEGAGHTGREKTSPQLRSELRKAASQNPVEEFSQDDDFDADNVGPTGTSRVRRGHFAYLVRDWNNAGMLATHEAAVLLGVQVGELEDWYASSG